MSSTLTTNLTIVNIDINKIITQPQIITQSLSNQQLNKLNQFLLDTIADKDGSPSIGDLSVSQLNLIETENNKGSFRLTFTIDRRFCCSGTEASQKDYIDFNFVVHNNILYADASYFNWSLNN